MMTSCNHLFVPRILDGYYVLSSCERCGLMAWWATPLRPDIPTTCPIATAHYHADGADMAEPRLHPAQQPNEFCYHWDRDGKPVPYLPKASE